MDDAWQFLVGGVGPRRWLALGAHESLGLPAARVRDRLRVRVSENPQQQAHAVLAQWQEWHAAGLAVAGYLGYDLGAALEGITPQPNPGNWPDADLCAFDPADLVPVSLPPVHSSVPLPLPSTFMRQEEAFCTAVEHALDAIAAGEIYQVNLSVEAELPIQVHATAPHQLAATLAVQPVPYAMVWNGPQGTVLSGSMEQFLRTRGDHVASRPIKGTAPRQPHDDEGAARRLADSVKERAENTMIVDMVRNDLQRACAWQSVQVTALCEPTPYRTLWHLESEVHGQLRQPQDRAALLAATLPPASVTGCPKIQATRVIGRLEQRWRGPYCGALGVDVPGVGLDLAVGIRQVWLEAGRARLQVGAGIVALSDPAREWQELCVKAEGALRLLGALAGLR